MIPALAPVIAVSDALGPDFCPDMGPLALIQDQILSPGDWIHDETGVLIFLHEYQACWAAGIHPGNPDTCLVRGDFWMVEGVVDWGCEEWTDGLVTPEAALITSVLMNTVGALAMRQDWFWSTKDRSRPEAVNRPVWTLPAGKGEPLFWVDDALEFMHFGWENWTVGRQR